MAIRLIIADDFKILRQDLEQILSGQEDMEVVGLAESGAQAVQLTETTGFDILLMDMEMEHMNAGVQAAKKILEAHPEAKVIFLTAHETDELIIEAMGTGAVDYIVKGCPDEELKEHIRAAYRGTPMMNEKIQSTVMREYNRLRRSEQSLLFFINNVSQLTQTERALVRFLLDGYKIRQIAEARCVEMVTVKSQISSLLRKFGCGRTKEIVDLIHALGVERLF